MKVCSKWVGLESPEWILNVFIHFYEGPDAFWTVLCDFLTGFESFLTLSGGIYGPFWGTKNGTKMGSSLGDFGPFLGRSGVISVSFGIILGFWCHFDLFLGSLSGLFRPIFGPFWPPFFPIFGPFLRQFCRFFGKLTATLSKIIQEKAKCANFCQNSHNAKLCEPCPFHL